MRENEREIVEAISKFTAKIINLPKSVLIAYIKMIDNEPLTDEDIELLKIYNLL
jgi:hypothetical protein